MKYFVYYIAKLALTLSFYGDILTKYNKKNQQKAHNITIYHIDKRR
jgi:hypothetical protein